MPPIYRFLPAAKVFPEFLTSTHGPTNLTDYEILSRTPTQKVPQPVLDFLTDNSASTSNLVTLNKHADDLPIFSAVDVPQFHKHYKSLSNKILTRLSNNEKIDKSDIFNATSSTNIIASPNLSDANPLINLVVVSQSDYYKNNNSTNPTDICKTF